MMPMRFPDLGQALDRVLVIRLLLRMPAEVSSFSRFAPTQVGRVAVVKLPLTLMPHIIALWLALTVVKLQLDRLLPTSRLTRALLTPLPLPLPVT